MSLALKESPDTTYASAAAARYALLHAPDKADFRTIVVASVSELVSHDQETLGNPAQGGVILINALLMLRFPCEIDDPPGLRDPKART